ncbi:internal virion protein [Vibrio phage D529]
MAAVGAWYAAATVAEVATVAVTAISAVASIQQQVQASKNASAQEEAAERRNDQLVEQTIANYDELSQVELEAQNQALDESMDMQKGYLRSKGRTNVMAAAMGTGGASVASQLQDLERTKYSNYNTILLSRQAKMDNIASQAESMRHQASASMDVSPISRPSWASTALDVGGSVLSGYTQLQGQKTESDLLKPSVSAGG